MKLTAKITTDAINFALTNSHVMSRVDALDRDPNVTIRQIISRVAAVDQNGIYIEIIYDYFSVTGSGPVQDMHVSIFWDANTSFTLKSINFVSQN